MCDLVMHLITGHWLSITTGNMPTQQEGLVAFKWFCVRWRELMSEFNNKKKKSQQSLSEESAAADQGHWCQTKVLWKIARHLQRYLVGMLIFLGGGQRRQIYAELMNDDLFRDEDDCLVIRVHAEKVP